MTYLYDPCSPCCGPPAPEECPTEETVATLTIDDCDSCPDGTVSVWAFQFKYALTDCPESNANVAMHWVSGCTWKSLCIRCGGADSAILWRLEVAGTQPGEVAVSLIGATEDIVYENTEDWQCDAFNRLTLTENSAAENENYPTTICLSPRGTFECEEESSVPQMQGPCSDCGAQNALEWTAQVHPSTVCDNFTLTHQNGCLYETEDDFNCGGESAKWSLDISGDHDNLSLTHGALTYTNVSTWRCLETNLFRLNSTCAIPGAPEYICLVPPKVDVQCGECLAVSQRYQVEISGMQNLHCDDCADLNGTYVLERVGECAWRVDIPIACFQCEPAAPTNGFISLGATNSAWGLGVRFSMLPTEQFGIERCEICTEVSFSLPAADFNCLGESVFPQTSFRVSCPHPPVPTGKLRQCIFPNTITVTAIA